MNNKILAALAVLPFVTFGLGVWTESALSSGSSSGRGFMEMAPDSSIPPLDSDRYVSYGVVLKKDSETGEITGHGYVQSDDFSSNHCISSMKRTRYFDLPDRLVVAGCAPISKNREEDGILYFPVEMNIGSGLLK